MFHIRDDIPTSNRSECPIARVARLIARHTCMRVQLIASDWETVDRARLTAEARGVSDNVTVHHALAFEIGSTRPRMPFRNDPQPRTNALSWSRNS